LIGWTLQDAWDCEQCVIRFTSHFDAGDFAAMEQDFSRTGVWMRSDGEVRGIDGLRAYLAQRGSRYFTRHILANIRVTPQGDGMASVDSYVTAYRIEPGDATAPYPLGHPFMVGRYRDELVREDGTWRIARRSTHTDFKS
jgi:hypothetical protein